MKKVKNSLMSDPQNSAAPAADPGQQNSWVSTLLKNVLLFYGINTAMKYFTGGANPSQVINENTSNSASPIVNTDKSLDNRSLSNILPGTTTFVSFILFCQLLGFGSIYWRQRIS